VRHHRESSEDKTKEGRAGSPDRSKWKGDEGKTPQTQAK